MTAGLTVFFAIVGTVVGSFLNVCIDRLPQRKSLIDPPSHCDGCQRRLGILDLIPVLSYIWLHGRCRYCGARISLRVPLVEVLGGILFALAYWRFGLTAQFGITAFWCSFFLVIIFIDWENKLILNRMTYPAAAAALVILAIDSALPGVKLLGNLDFIPRTSILSGLIGGGVGLGFFLIVFLINPRGMGMGDVKLAGLIGLVTGWPLVMVALLIGILLGGVAAIVILAFRLKGRKDVIAYGTFLAIGPVITLLWGVPIFHWYQNLFGFSVL
jgi:leader peptidase (prepilin peptidase)/N-methyltransferase